MLLVQNNGEGQSLVLSYKSQTLRTFSAGIFSKGGVGKAVVLFAHVPKLQIKFTIWN
jgi:hypothetical protein